VECNETNTSPSEVPDGSVQKLWSWVASAVPHDRKLTHILLSQWRA
jgi:hypothetical protein